MNAMTWWDHKTGSIWSQPWGAAIFGRLRGETLDLIPAEVTTWKAWHKAHPGTTVLVDEEGRDYGHYGTQDGFVIGIAIEDEAVGYFYRATADSGAVNDRVGGFPIVVFADPEDRSINAYVREPASVPDDAGPAEVLNFELRDDGAIVDKETGSHWDPRHGVATEGHLKGAELQPVPWISSFPWAWEDFYPHTRFWGEPKG